MGVPHNPPAFPPHAATCIPNGRQGDWSGMSLRDWLAGQAISGLLASGSGAYNVADTDDCAIYAANRAYAVADAMLIARGLD